MRSKAQRKYTTHCKFMIIFYFGPKIHLVHFQSLNLGKERNFQGKEVREGERVGCHGFGNQNDQAWCQWVLLNENSSMILDFFYKHAWKKESNFIFNFFDLIDFSFSGWF